MQCIVTLIFFKHFKIVLSAKLAFLSNIEESANRFILRIHVELFCRLKIDSTFHEIATRFKFEQWIIRLFVYNFSYLKNLITLISTTLPLLHSPHLAGNPERTNSFSPFRVNNFRFSDVKFIGFGYARGAVFN